MGEDFTFFGKQNAGDDAGFCLMLDTLSDRFSSEFEDVTVQNGQYVRGNGACKITVNAMSGSVMIRKAPSPAQ